MGSPNLDRFEDLIGVDQDDYEADLKIFQAIRARRTMQLGRWGVNEIVKREGLVPFLEFFDLFNEAMTVPYHNEYHTCCMVLNCYEGFYYERIVPAVKSIGDLTFEKVFEESIKQREDLRVLLVAALFHDFNHSGGKAPNDGTNIERAIKGLEVAFKYAVAQGCRFTEEQLETVRQLIEITKYPFEAEPMTPQECIIRDSDLMQIYEEDPGTLIKQFLGLKAEVELQRGPMTNEEFAKGQRAWFNTTARFYTRWALDKAEARLVSAQDNLEELLLKA